jgi:predicted component of type VI protein secretion system
MNKVLITIVLTIFLSACSSSTEKEVEPSMYKKAIDDSKQVQINIDKQVEINGETIK